MSTLERYSRQMLLPQIGEQGQERLLSSSVAVIGCGALGSVIASSVVRAGVGRVNVVDRDYIELNNLQRQILFDEEDVATGLPKAIAAVQKLRRINSQVQIEPVVADVNPGNVEEIVRGCDLVLDGTDNFETRLLLNDACVKHGLPWVYGAVISTYGMSMAIVPHITPCFRCLLNSMPSPGSTATCDTAGVLATAVNIVASLEVTEGLKVLLGHEHELHRKLTYVDAWHATMEQFEVGKGDLPCRACDLGEFEFLEATAGTYLTSLCGRDAVQISLRDAGQVAFPVLAERLAAVGDVRYNEYMLRLNVGAYELTVFPDGRAIIKGTSDESVARTLYSKYIGA